MYQPYLPPAAPMTSCQKCGVTGTQASSSDEKTSRDKLASYQQGSGGTLNAAEVERRLTSLENCTVSCTDFQNLQRRVAALECRGF
jgi:hypothetical protein